MFCSSCGQELANQGTFCPHCGTQTGAPTLPTHAQQTPTTGFQRKIRTLALVWFVYCALCLYYLIKISDQVNSQPITNNFDRAFFILMISSWTGVLLGLAAAIGLLNFQRWGRTLTIVASILAIPSVGFPFGTAIGIWSLLVLLKNENAVAYKALAT